MTENIKKHHPTFTKVKVESKKNTIPNKIINLTIIFSFFILRPPNFSKRRNNYSNYCNMFFIAIVCMNSDLEIKKLSLTDNFYFA